MTVLSFDDVNGDGITRDAALDSGDTFDSRAKNINYGGTGGANVTTVFYQGAGSAARKIGTAGGMGYTVGNYTSRDQTAVTYRNVMSKCWITNISAVGPLGMDFGVGSGTGAAIGNDQHWWTVADDGTIPAPGFALSPAGGFVFKLIDTQLKAFRRGTSGTPDETAMLNFMVWVDLLNTGGTDRNLIIDSPDYVETGFHVVGGTSTDPEITFQDVVDEDEGSGSTNFARAGLWRTVEGIIYHFGRLEVGRNYANTDTESQFDDSFKTLVCPGGYVREGANTLEFVITNALSTMLLSNISLGSTGRDKSKLLFDATDSGSGGDVNVTLDEIAYVAHGLETGETVLYSQEGETGAVVSVTGGESQLVTGTTGPYYYAINVSADVFAVGASFALALAGTRVALTAQSAETHSFQRTPCTFPDLLVTSDASPGTFDMNTCNIQNYNRITLAQGCELDGCNVVTSHQILLNEGILTDCNIIQGRTWNNVAAVVLDTPNASATAEGALTRCSFTQGPRGGHAIEITATGTYVWETHSYTGYAASDGSTGDEVLFNDSGGAVTIDVLLSGATPTVMNGTSATTTINNSVTVLVNGVAEGTAITVIANETAGTVTIGDVLGSGLANSTGAFSFALDYEGAFGAGLDVILRARNQGLCNAAIADDGGVFVDETTASNNATVDDMTLTPTTAVNGDAYIYGHSEQFFRLKQNVTDVGSGFAITWQYWNGAWTNLGSVVDGTSSFSVSGTNIVSWADPGDWIVTTINSQGPFFFVRALVGSVSGPNQARGRSATLDVTRYLPIPQSGLLEREITASGLTATLSQAVDAIAKFDPLND